jgi:hypothetical protein
MVSEMFSLGNYRGCVTPGRNRTRPEGPTAGRSTGGIDTGQTHRHDAGTDRVWSCD